MGRSLPGILESGIWPALTSPIANSPNHQIARSFALITDIGNDIMYGTTPETITNWVERCIDRLESLGARVTINPPPVESIQSIKRWQYAIVRALLFPTRRLTFDTAIGRALELHGRVIELAQRRNILLINSEREWYGFDPIHIRRTFWYLAWGKMVSGSVGRNGEFPHSRNITVGETLHLRTRTPETWRILALRRGRTQPSGLLKDGSTISLF